MRSHQLVFQLGPLAGSHFRGLLPLRSLVGHRTFWKLTLLSDCWEVRERPPRRRLCWRPRVLLEVERPEQRPAQAKSLLWLGPGPAMQLLSLCLAPRLAGRCWALSWRMVTSLRWRSWLPSPASPPRQLAYSNLAIWPSSCFQSKLPLPRQQRLL